MEKAEKIKAYLDVQNLSTSTKEEEEEPGEKSYFGESCRIVSELMQSLLILFVSLLIKIFSFFVDYFLGFQFFKK